MLAAVVRNFLFDTDHVGFEVAGDRTLAAVEGLSIRPVGICSLLRARFQEREGRSHWFVDHSLVII